MPEFPPFITDAQDRLVVANGTDDDRAISVKKGESVFVKSKVNKNHPRSKYLVIESDKKKHLYMIQIRVCFSSPLL